MLTTLIRRTQVEASSPSEYNWGIHSPIWSVLGSLFRTRSKQTISHQSAFCNPTAGSCVRIIAEEMASLPHRFFKGNQDTRVQVRDSVPDKLLWKPNRWQTRYEWMEMMIGHLALRGNAYSEVTAGRGELIPLHPERVKPELQRDRTVVYKITPAQGREYELSQFQVLHLKLLAPDGVTGLSPVALHRESIGLDEAARDHAATFWGNAAKPNGFIAAKTPLGAEGMENLKRDVASLAEPENRDRTPVFGVDLDWKQVGMSARDSQYLESRKFTRAEIAAIWRVPLHLLNDLDGAKYNNMELQDLALLKHTLRPYMVRVEERISHTLIYEDLPEEEGMFMEFVAEGLLRGDTTSRYNSYRTGLGGPGTGAGWLCVNDVRRLENLPPIEGGDEVYLGERPQPADNTGTESSGGTESAGTDPKLLADAYGVAVRSGALTPQLEDEQHLRRAMGLPEAGDDVQSVWEIEPTRRPITLANDKSLTPLEEDDITPPSVLPVEDPDSENDDEPEAKSRKILIADLAGRLLNVEARNVGPRLKHVAEDPSRFATWAESYFAKHAGYAAKQLAPLAELCGVDAQVVATGYAARRLVLVQSTFAGTHAVHPHDVEQAIHILTEEVDQCLAKN